MNLMNNINLHLTKIKKTFKYIRNAFFIMIAFILWINLLIVYQSSKYIVKENASLPKVDALIVLGAGVYSDGTLSPILRDRVDTSLELLEKNKEVKILASGDHGTKNYDEVNTMRKYLEKKGVDSSIIFMDHAGFSTYESMYRAKEIFKVKKAVIISQSYHLKRAIYIARQLGIESYGVASDKRMYLGMVKYQLRESLARCKDFFLVNVFKPEPTYLGEAIPIMNSNGKVTHDKKEE